MPKVACLLLPLALFAARLLGSSGPTPVVTVAIVGALQGTATLRGTADASPEPLAPGRRLAPGAVLETAPGAAVTVVFFDGQRQVLLSGGRATVQADGLNTKAGEIRRLARVPAIVDLAPLLRDSAARPRSLAVRLRGESAALRKVREAWEALALEAERTAEPDLRQLLHELGPEPQP